MHNNIMAAGSRDRPPMLATGRCANWQSRFMRYIDTKPNGEAQKKCILDGPYKFSNIINLGQPATDESPEVPERTTLETFSNLSPENKAHYEAEKKAIHLILTGIGDDIYSTVDACKTTHDMWVAIERLQQGESLNKQDMMNEMVRNQLEVATMQVNVQFLQQLQPEWSRFVTIVKQTQELDTISYHKLFDILKQYQKEVNEIHAEKITRNVNPLALVAATQPYQETYYQAPKPQKSYAPPTKQSSTTKSHDSTRHKGKEIAKPITPPSESAFEEDSDPEQVQRDKDMQKNLALIAKYFKKLYKPTNNNLRTYSNSRNKNVDTILRYLNENQTGQFGNQRTEVLPADSGSDAEPLEKVKYNANYNVIANERQHSEQPESINNTYVVEKVYSNIIPDSLNMCDNDNQADQNAKECDDERVMLATLIVNLQLDIEENKKIQKQLKQSNASLAQELKECKSTLKETNRTLGESNRTRDIYLGALHDKEVELAKYKIFKDRTS
ncbi:hypothetical protein Tco_0169500 [Tanacetum coccineum]